MQIIQSYMLTKTQISEIETLQSLSFLPEGLENHVFLSSEMNVYKDLDCFFLGYENDQLVSFLGAFLPSRKEVEFNGFTHPDHRRKGCFTLLVEHALTLYRPYSFTQALFQRELNSKSGFSYLQKRYPELDRSEYLMTLEQQHWNNKDTVGTLELVTEQCKEETIAVMSDAFEETLDESAHFLTYLLNQSDRKTFLYRQEGTAVGVMNALLEDGVWVIHGVGILHAFRNQGMGRHMLSLAFDVLFQDAATIQLEVDSQNPPALSLYRKLGFQTTSQVDYHRLIL
ncbi:GNAT family N-acetyltransferase [Sphaerochaeta globosa]|uniref:GCN5-related N-acetyltransferase n=1 Tax=Sphaerochaeta globosa (strain ATCC BAA-1886 / DSM 22777 / Buddy) TaxID=158189 RepID=F0RZS7_SPHGB|nr:GNAT family N-acetyltransferase [Sphaerochaeta globosa]ADY14828.1 GCN5-related N-acetyltransferase [Sphaerochaeta globosa str. Buddy]